jgi:DNA processing protein
MKDIDDKRLILALAILRIPCLRPEERLILWDLVDDELSLSLLLTSDIEAAVGRSLGGRPWNPDSCLEAAVRDARFLERSGCRFVHHDDEAYPRALRATSRPPFGLFARGLGFDPAADAVAIVGTRIPTGRGLDAAFALSRDLSAQGVPVVSGLARGIDAAAHRGALAAQRGALSGSAAGNGGLASGATCAVLPCGIDRVYPPGNRALASAMLESGGLLLSEYPPGTEIHKYRFPERNRIIAGLCRACIVVEAPAKSGALITAEHALDEGRDVWVARDCLGGQRSAGIDRLAAEGAPALADAAELLADWSVGAGRVGRRPGRSSAESRDETGEVRNGR